ncbi:MAG: hypothetical protein RSD55_03670 [Lachnospiraceae bacterium]
MMELRRNYARSIHYWSIVAERAFGGTIILAIFYAFLFPHMSGESGYFISILESFPTQMMFMGTLYTVILQLSQNGTGISLVLSFGSSRREALLGLQWMNILFIVQLVVSVFLLNLVIGTHKNVLIPLMICFSIVLLFFLAVSQIMGAFLMKKKGRSLIAIMSIVIGGIIFAMGVVLGFRSKSVTHLMTCWEETEGLWLLTAAVGILVILIYGMSVVFMRHALRTFEVKG